MDILEETESKNEINYEDESLKYSKISAVTDVKSLKWTKIGVIISFISILVPIGSTIGVFILGLIIPTQPTNVLGVHIDFPKMLDGLIVISEKINEIIRINSTTLILIGAGIIGLIILYAYASVEYEWDKKLKEIHDSQLEIMVMKSDEKTNKTELLKLKAQLKVKIDYYISQARRSDEYEIRNRLNEIKLQFIEEGIID